MKATNTQTDKTKKTVTFYPSVRVLVSLHINDYTDDEIASSWYSSKEAATIRSNYRQAVKSLSTSLEQQNQPLPDNEEDCIRGLESSLPKYRKRRTSRRLNAWDAVLLEQESQWNAGKVDEERLAAIYKKHTKSSQVSANRVAMKDHLEVMKMDREGCSTFQTRVLTNGSSNVLKKDTYATTTTRIVRVGHAAMA